MFDRRLQVRFLPCEQRSISRQLLTDGIEEGAEVSEFVAWWQVERDAEFTLAEARQTAADHIDGPQEQLREYCGNHDRDQQRCKRDVERGTQRRIQLLAHQYSRYANADRAERLIAEHHLLPHLEDASVASVDRTKLIDRIRID